LRARARAGFDLPSSSATVVISQVYGGGGNSGSIYKNDFIEIHNRGTEAVSLLGWSVQYASATGTTFAVTALGGSIAPGQYLLVQEAAGAGGTTALPTPDFTGNIAMSATDAKVALVTATTPIALTCTGTPVACTTTTPATIADLVGYGTANYFEGAAAAPKLANATADSRLLKGCQDTDNNSADFASGAAAPRNAASPAVTCDLTPVGPVDHVTISPETATIIQGATQAFTATAFDAANHQVAGTLFTWSLDPTSSGVASVNPATGIATGIVPGDVGIVATAGAFSDTATLHVTPTTPLPETRFSEIHYDNAGDDVSEQIEIEGPAGTDLSGWSIALYDGGSQHVYDTRALTGSIPATCDTRGVVAVRFETIQNGSPDGFALIHGTEVVEFLSYEGVMTATDGPANGLTSTDIVVQELSNSSDISSLQRNSFGVWSGPTRRSFGRCNSQGPPPFDLTFSGRQRLTDPPLPVGFEDQLFPTMVAVDGVVVPTTFTWTTESPDIATIDQQGVMHGLAAGNAFFRATAANGTSASVEYPIVVPVFSPTAVYAGNTEFGVPHDANASDDQIIVHPEFTASYSNIRNTPNWVSWVLESSHFGDGTVDRCDCFTHDPLLPPSFTHLSTADYTGAGAAAGFGIDRGHLARSFDFTAAPGDNAIVYLLSNIIPQASDLNQGPWASEENDLGAIARTGGKDIYTIAGVAGNKGTLKNEGKIVMPASVWKVAVIVPHGEHLADIHSTADLEVIAVIMPNDPGVRAVDWHTYITTVDAVEALSGYDLLDLLPDKIERAVESSTKPPVAIPDGPYTSLEGSSVTMSGFASFDPNGTVVSFAWNFGDGSAAIGGAVAHTYAQDGSYTVQLIATDNDGLADTTVTTAQVANVAPAISPLAAATLLPGETYSFASSFIDPGADTWSAMVDYGDGSGVRALLLSAKTFSLGHTYNRPGSFTLAVSVSDDDVTSTATQLVTVLSESQGLDQIAAAITNLVNSGKLSSKDARKLLDAVDDARKDLARGRPGHAGDELEHLLKDLDNLIRSQRLSASDAAPLRSILGRVIHSLSLQDDDDRRGNGKRDDDKHDDNDRHDFNDRR
jgi:DNA/RNA endonuclease G (NUC1)